MVVFAGLILGAVAKELFPQISTAGSVHSSVGITVGFFMGLFFVNFLDYVVDLVENYFTRQQHETDSMKSEASYLELARKNSYQSVNSGDAEIGDNAGGPTSFIHTHDRVDNDSPVIQLAQQAIASPMHRERIRTQVAQLVDSIASIEDKSNRLLKSSTARRNSMGRPGFVPSSNSSKSDVVVRSHDILQSGQKTVEEETCADQIDEEIHRLQYTLDHCRRCVFVLFALMSHVGTDTRMYIHSDSFKVQNPTSWVWCLVCGSHMTERALCGTDWRS